MRWNGVREDIRSCIRHAISYTWNTDLLTLPVWNTETRCIYGRTISNQHLHGFSFLLHKYGVDRGLDECPHGEHGMRMREARSHRQGRKEWKAFWLRWVSECYGFPSVTGFRVLRVLTGLFPVVSTLTPLSIGNLSIFCWRGGAV